MVHLAYDPQGRAVEDEDALTEKSRLLDAVGDQDVSAWPASP
ncbi:hypothetical protein [Heliomicrobium modesticaldum]|nr:hypothetical protein [Heliomicrobium modesticaldum]